jgi:phosphatidylinositol phosphate synthase
MNEAPTPRLSRVKQGYTTGVRSLASRSVTSLARTRVSPNALTAAGVTLCLGAAAIVPFEDRDKLLFYWLGAAVFVVGSILDILDGALARAGGKSTPFGAFLDSTTDRVGEGAMLAAIALVFTRAGNDAAVVFTVAAVAGSLLVPYVRAKAEALGLRGDVGLGSRAERVVVIAAGLVLAPWGALQWAIYLLAATAWLTVVQRVLHVRKQLLTERLYELPVFRTPEARGERPVPGTGEHGGANVDQR